MAIDAGWVASGDDQQNIMNSLEWQLWTIFGLGSCGRDRRRETRVPKRCDECRKEITITSGNFFEIFQSGLDITETYCSPSCLVEGAWRVKESQMKLSKSKVDKGIIK